MSGFIDTNIFVYATYPAFPEHKVALKFLRACRKSHSQYAMSWSVVYEYLRVVTQPRLFPSGAILFEHARENVAKFMEAPNVMIVQELPNHLDTLHRIVHQCGKSRGNILHDAHHVALMTEHGISTIYTADTDFRLFANITLINPLEA
ncbi:MAG: PIN domain-containing protein [Deltaproteobacteria bacterium]|nr:PIN domain-containing protein [Deltaproteobacteria bacterium]